MCVRMHINIHKIKNKYSALFFSFLDFRERESKREGESKTKSDEEHGIFILNYLYSSLLP